MWYGLLIYTYIKIKCPERTNLQYDGLDFRISDIATHLKASEYTIYCQTAQPSESSPDVEMSVHIQFYISDLRLQISQLLYRLIADNIV